MATLTAGTADKLAYRSITGAAGSVDSVAIRLAPSATGTVYIERSTQDTPADPSSSFYISNGDIYNATLVAGECLHVITETDDIEIRIDGNDSGEFGS